MQGLFSLFSFTSPLALTALAAITIPVLVHLFNRSKGQRVVVGTLEFVRGAKSKRVTEIKLMHLLLLALRIAIFVLLSLIMAGLMKDTTEKVQRASVYVSNGWLATATPEELAQVRAMADTIQVITKDGIYSSDFNELSHKSNVSPEPVDISGRLTARLAQTRHEGAIHVFARSAAGELADIDALSRYDIEWHLRPAGPGVADGSPSPLAMSILLVRDEGYEAQAAAVVDALSRIDAHRNVDLTLNIVSAAALDSTQVAASDWLFWMSAQDAAPHLSGLEKPVNLLSFSPEPRAGTVVRDLTLGIYPFSQFTAAATQQDGPATGDALWRSTRGDLLLSRETQGSVTAYRLHIALTGQPGSLATQPEFPVALLALLTHDADLASRYPDAAINSPKFRDAGHGLSATGTIPSNRSLQALLAALLLLLWVAERLLSERARYE